VSIVGEVGERGDGVLDGALRRVAIWAFLNVANYSIPFIGLLRSSWGINYHSAMYPWSLGVKSMKPSSSLYLGLNAMTRDVLVTELSMGVKEMGVEKA
jgi:hypothetical protein